MKKILAVLIVAVMALSLFTGCGDDPLYDDFANYLNVEMAEINAEYEKITEEVSKWETFEDDSALAASISEVVLPLIESSIEKLEGVNPETEKVKALKAKYAKVMDTYKVGFEALLEGCETQDDEIINKGYENLNEGMDLLGEYNESLEALAKETGSEIEY